MTSRPDPARAAQRLACIVAACTALAGACVAASAGPASAGKPAVTLRPADPNPVAGSTQRIHFAPVTNTASVHAHLAPATTHSYVLRAAGQTMAVQVAPLVPNITFTILAPDGTSLAEDQNQATVMLPANGDQLVVVETTSSGGPYQITLWIA